MAIYYLCVRCCQGANVEHTGAGINEDGRKSCSVCGDDSPNELTILNESEWNSIDSTSGEGFRHSGGNKDGKKYEGRNAPKF